MADMADDMADLLVIGQVVVDDTPDGPRPGGAAYYSALTATRLGYHVAVVTAPHALLDVLAALDGVAVHLTDAPATTVFRHRDSESGRISHWSGSGPVMRIEDIPPLWRDTPAVLVAPVAQEVSREIPGLFRRSLVALSPQGWLRRRDRAGLVLPGPWLGARAALNAAQIVIASQEDVMSRPGHSAAADSNAGVCHYSGVRGSVAPSSRALGYGARLCRQCRRHHRRRRRLCRRFPHGLLGGERPARRRRLCQRRRQPGGRARGSRRLARPRTNHRALEPGGSNVGNSEAAVCLRMARWCAGRLFRYARRSL